MIDVTAIITGHREGIVAGPSIMSVREAIACARQQGLRVEIVVILDAPDDVTRSMFADWKCWCDKLIVTECGDPGLARNRGVAEAAGQYVTFLDADDLWSFNWVTEAHRLCSLSTQEIVVHSEINVIFGGARQLWLHMDSESPFTNLSYLQIGNYWDALALARRDVYLKFPFQKNDLEGGFGHEDWHWNCVTIAEGIVHRPAPGTVHMKRRRNDSQSSRANDKDVVPWHHPLSLYSWKSPSSKCIST